MKQRFIRMTGFTLLPVVLAMSLIAAIAFLLNRDNGMNVDMVASQMDADRAHYAAEAGLQAVNATIQSKGCVGGFPVAGSPVKNADFGGASYSAHATSGSGNTTSLVSTGTYNGTSITLTRKDIYVYQKALQAYTLQPDEGKGIDAYIQQGHEHLHGDRDKLDIKNNESVILLKFGLTEFPSGSRPTSSKFSIHTSTDLGISGVDFYRITSDWIEGTDDNNAVTWNTRDGIVAWTTPGGDTHPVKLNTTTILGVPNAWTFFDVTDLTTAWMSGQYPNQGFMLKSNGDLGTIKYLSSDDGDVVHRPRIEFNYMLPCGTTGPMDSPSGTLTLNAIADGFNDSGANLASNGKATELTTYYTPTRENRVMIKFDTGAVPPGATVKSATVRLFVNNVDSKSGNLKKVWANAVAEPWEEGNGVNTDKTCPSTPTAGTSWNYRHNCKNWSFIHPPESASGWTAMANMPSPRTGHAVATVNGKIYAIGGTQNLSAQLNTVEEYDPATNTWTTKAPMPTARWWANAHVVDGKIYVIGGERSSVTQNANEMYDPATDTWTTMASMPSARKAYGSAVVNNKIYIFGGGKTNAATRNTYEYDPATNSWATKKSMPTARKWPNAEVANGKIYVFGGSSGPGYLTQNEVYDPAGNSWSTKRDLPVGTDAMASEVLGSKIYLTAGRRAGGSPTDSVLMYDTLSDNYVNIANYPLSILNADATTINGKIHVMGGYNGFSAVANHYRYDSGMPMPLATAANESTGDLPLASDFNSGWITFDLKPLVQEWVDGITPNNGVVIYTEVEDKFRINSRENSSNNPQLIVTY
jgi:N-acetylneuraminic acid mutarotase/Tfp pilus assembly protein PilX